MFLYREITNQLAEHILLASYSAVNLKNRNISFLLIYVIARMSAAEQITQTISAIVNFTK